LRANLKKTGTIEELDDKMKLDETIVLQKGTFKYN